MEQNFLGKVFNLTTKFSNFRKLLVQNIYNCYAKVNQLYGKYNEKI